MNPKPHQQKFLLLRSETKFCNWLCAHEFPHTTIVSLSKSQLKHTLTGKVVEPCRTIILTYLKTQEDEKYTLELMLHHLQSTPNLKFFHILEFLNLNFIKQCLKLGSTSLMLRSEFENNPEEVLNQFQIVPFVLSPKLLTALLEKFKQPMTELLRLKKLTPREIQVLDLIAQGLLNRDIKTKLEISENTVKSLTYKIYKKLEVSNRVGAVRKYLNV